jgi:hypothetical protein
MKRCASQSIYPSAKRAADDSSYTETEEWSSDTASPSTSELLDDSSSCSTSSSASPAKVEPDEKEDAICPYIKIEEIMSLVDIPVTQISRSAFLLIRNDTFFSILSTDIFTLILARLYGPPQEPLGNVDTGAPPDVSVKLITPLPRLAQIKNVTPTQYSVACAFADEDDDSETIERPQRIDVAAATCAKEVEAYFVENWLGEEFDLCQEFVGTDDLPLLCFPANCRTKYYVLKREEFILKEFPNTTIACYEPSSLFNYTCGVVFSSNHVGLFRSRIVAHGSRCMQHQLEYFSPLLDVHAEYELDTELVEVFSCCCDTADVLYVFGTSIDQSALICVYSLADNCTELKQIKLGSACGFCLTPKGDLLVARETHVDLYKKK